MKVSVIMASYLGPYKGAAMNRDKKIIRAVNSVLAQDYDDLELVVVADGCNETVELLKSNYQGNENIKGYFIPKQKKWAGVPRNTGIEKAAGEWVCYLDIDDYFGTGHVSGIMSQIKPSDDWVWFDDFIINKEANETKRRVCSLTLGKCGTSNIMHRKIAQWDINGNYAHDWRFIKNLQAASGKYRKILAGQYVVCHIPGRLDA